MLSSSRQERSKLRCYPKNQIPVVWNKYRDLIQKALDRGSEYSIADIYHGLLKEEMQLWAWGEDAALVTTIQNKDDKRWCLLLALGGSKMDEWSECLPIVEDWAFANGCQELRIYGRLGWKKLGFKLEYAKLVKEICPEDRKT